MSRITRADRVGTLLLVAVLSVGCAVPSSPPPSSPAADAPSSTIAGRVSQAPRATASPLPADIGCAPIVASMSPPRTDTTLPPPPSPTIAGSDAGSITAITAAVDALGALRSYRMSLDVVGLDVTGLQPTSSDLGVRGMVTHTSGLAMDVLVGVRMREPNGSAAISSGARYVMGDGYVWATDNLSEVLEPSSDASIVSLVVLLSPEGLATRAIEPFAGGYRRIGIETHGGIKTVHYRADRGGAAAYADVFHFPGTITADLWIAATGGELVGARVAGTSSHQDPSSGATVDDSVLIAFEVTDPDSATTVVVLPRPPIADPVRPSEPPVDLKLEYQVMPSNGTRPTAADLDSIGVALRTRLDVSKRPVKVDVSGDRLVVTVCGTTDPDADRRLMVAPGALTVVPLPAADYGTTTAPGGTALPAVGAPIDPALRPVAPAARLGLAGSHVDPTTGRRGIAFKLANEETDAFLVYAAARPGEYVAVVLDGVVLATLPVEGTTAKGRFAFAGDYTEAETHRLAMSLYSDPISFELRPTSDIAIPTR